MSLLDTASLIVTPNGYKEGKLYSVIPSDGSGDLSVTRATTATRVNSQGLVELVPYNLFTYSEQFDNADWQKRNNIAITANATTAPNGTLTADKMYLSNNLLADYGIFQILPSNNYTLSVYAKKAEIGYLYLGYNNDTAADGVFYNLNNGTISSNTSSYTASITDEGNGWYRCSVTLPTLAYAFISPSTNGTSFIVTGQLNNGLYIWGAQLNDGTLKDYQKTETRLNIPRLDYSNGTCPSILLEPQRTNLVTYSENFNSSNGYNYQNASFSSSSIVSPSGLTAKGITSATSANDFHRFYKSLGGLTGTYTTTIYGKKGTSRYLGLGINQNGSTGNNNVVVFDLQDGVIASNIYGVTASIQDVGDGWYRCEHTFNYGTGGTYADICVHNTGTGAFTINAFQTFDSPTAPTTLYIYGLQLEAGSYATSYIPTTSASVTRNGDAVYRDSLSVFGTNQGTFFTDCEGPYFTNYEYLFDLSDNSSPSANRFAMYSSPTGLLLYTDQERAISASNTARKKIAIAWDASNTRVYINGSQVLSFSYSNPNPTSINLNSRFSENEFGNSRFYSVATWPTKLTATQLAQLTTI